jgi:hypothetical protein
MTDWCKMKIDPNVVAAPPPKTRLYCGMGILLVFNMGVPFLGIPIVAITSLSVETKALVSGIFVIVGELSLPVAIAILGKPGFVYAKSLIFRRLKRIAPPAEVSIVRYRIGLVMFVIPLVFAAIEPYAGSHIGVNADNRLAFALAGDALLISSMFVLGGNFWDKIRSLFVHDATAEFHAIAESH